VQRSAGKEAALGPLLLQAVSVVCWWATAALQPHPRLLLLLLLPPITTLEMSEGRRLAQVVAAATAVSACH
jgi:hypothetical protein